MPLIKVFNDNSIMPFGKHKGKKMIDVPYYWFLWYEQQPPLRHVHDRVKEDDKAIRAYIADVKDWLLAEQKQAQENKKNHMFDPYR